MPRRQQRANWLFSDYKIFDTDIILEALHAKYEVSISYSSIFLAVKVLNL